MITKGFYPNFLFGLPGRDLQWPEWRLKNSFTQLVLEFQNAHFLFCEFVLRKACQQTWMCEACCSPLSVIYVMLQQFARSGSSESRKDDKDSYAAWEVEPRFFFLSLSNKKWKRKVSQDNNLSLPQQQPSSCLKQGKWKKRRKGHYTSTEHCMLHTLVSVLLKLMRGAMSIMVFGDQLQIN